MTDAVGLALIKPAQAKLRIVVCRVRPPVAVNVLAHLQISGKHQIRPGIALNPNERIAAEQVRLMLGARAAPQIALIVVVAALRVVSGNEANPSVRICVLAASKARVRGKRQASEVGE